MPDCRLSPRVRESLACPACSGAIIDTEERLACAECGATFPLQWGVPVLLDDDASLFTCQQVLDQALDMGAQPDRPAPTRTLHHLLPHLTCNSVAAGNYREMFRTLSSRSASPLVLVIGAGDGGMGSEAWAEFPHVQTILTDVYLGPRTQLVCDAHALPFQSGSVDGVILQAVADDLVRPDQAIAEVHRVLKPDGLIYSETPFLQPVHDGPFDFQRYTHLGHRKLLRDFVEVRSGTVGGAGQALALAYHAFLMSLASGRRSRIVLSLFAHATGWWVKYLDSFVANRPAALDAACGCYFLGRRSDRPLSDRELIMQYRGAQQRARTEPPVPEEVVVEEAGEAVSVQAGL